MIEVRKSRERGHAHHGWLDSYHTFSFADYHDPQYMGFRKLRVINEDRVAPGQGFGMHSHRDMEIITYVFEGSVAHKDSMGNESVIRTGDVQRMSAGTGVTHSEFNPSTKEPLHLLQIWILPEKPGIQPSYEQRTLKDEERLNRLSPVAIKIHQDVALYSSILEAGKKVQHHLEKGRHAWLQVVRGSVSIYDTLLREGDGAAVSDEAVLPMIAGESSEILLFDLA